MSCCVRPTLPSASWITGSSISTSLRAGSLGVSNDAHDTTATSRVICICTRRPPPRPPPNNGAGCAGSYVFLVVVVRRVRFAGRSEVLDVSEVGLALALVDPHRLDPHAEPHVLRLALLDQEHRGDVGAVEADPRGDVGRVQAGARHGGDAERGDRAPAGERQLLV